MYTPRFFGRHFSYIVGWSVLPVHYGSNGGMCLVYFY